MNWDKIVQLGWDLFEVAMMAAFFLWAIAVLVEMVG